MDDEFDYGAEVLAAGGPDHPDPEEVPTPAPEDSHTADRYGRKIARLKAEHATAMARYDELLRELEAWRDDVVGGLDRQIQYLERVLEDWARANGATSQIKLPHVTVKTQKGRTSVVVTDLDALIAWVVNHEDPTITYADYMRVQVEAKKSALAKLLNLSELAGEKPDEMPAVIGGPGDGEIVPGVKMVNPGRWYAVVT